MRFVVPRQKYWQILNLLLKIRFISYIFSGNPHIYLSHFQ
ncbi:hypothetical Protein YC6258_01655 [Gynuella sunshinyii YC6258]|uniref:Uncharacterized protein n=1 Tax=Gynuella sunshinyii YC6258 TaxID=1445510 RepID=A0A0C5VK08_9GAMM|nr:hypothetical Protein YC6258_01655 [Gynuella sunshinyii YC6258]